MIIDISSSLSKPNLFDKFKIQTIKDFELAGVGEFSPKMESNNLSYLKQEFYNSVLQLEMSNALKNLLYRVDISEVQIKTECGKFPQSTMQNILAELLIKRILQKVVLKEKYSN